jgi:hypothetical protein
MNITYRDYVAPMIPFLRSLPDAIRTCPEDPSLKFYGTGDTGHWAVQCSQQVFAALAILADVPDLEELGCPWSAERLRELALSLFRYSIRTHLTGDLPASDGQRWGRHWISVLGLERAVPGLNALYPHMTADDRARLRALDLFEADYRLNDYPIEAAIDANTGHNKPESNIWNAGFLFRAAANYPDCPNAAAYVEKGTRMMLAGLSYPADAESGEIIAGRPLKDWYVGPNFTENWSLDHHHYMNVGYAYVCLSNLALLHFNFKERGQKEPDCLLHHVRDLWQVVKKFAFPDGRLLRVGGDSRSRYTYCQNFAQQAYILAAELFGDEDAIRYEKGYIALMEKEQRENADGSFFGRRLSRLRDESYYFYRRLEADPFFALACGAHWRRKFNIPSEAPDLPSPVREKPYTWSDNFHSAALRREGNVARSVTRAGHAVPVPTTSFCTNVPEYGYWNATAVCAPLDRSDLAEWGDNLFGFIGLRQVKFDDKPVATLTDGGFRWTTAGDIWEQGPVGEGEHPAKIGHRAITVEALPDGKTMLFADRLVTTAECTFVHGWRAVRLLVPNDVYNGYARQWRGTRFSFMTETAPGVRSLVETGERALNVDNALSVFAIQGVDLKIWREAEQNIFLYNGLRSLYADEVCMDCELASKRLKAGTVVYDVVYAVAANVTAEETAALPMRGQVSGSGANRVASFIGFDGKTYTVSIPQV